MPTLNPPDDWILTTGTWGTDADISTSRWQTGGQSLRLGNSAQATKAVSKYQPLLLNPSTGTLIAWVNNVRLYAYATVGSDDDTAGNNVKVDFVTYNQSFVEQQRIVVANGVYGDATGGMYDARAMVTLGTNDAWYRFECFKAANAFYAYFDRVGIEWISPVSRMERTSALTATTGGTWTDVDFDSSAIETAIINLTSSDTVTISYPGYYIQMGYIFFEGINTDTIAGLGFGGTNTQQDMALQPCVAAISAYGALNVQRISLLAANDTVKLRYYFSGDTTIQINRAELYVARLGDFKP